MFCMEKNVMKIIYCTPQVYLPGGVERVLSIKANYLIRKGYDVSIITTDQNNRSSFYPLDPQIHLYDLNINYERNRSRTFLTKLIHYCFNKIKHRYRLKRLIESLKPDIVISMFRNEMPHILKINDGSKKVLEYHCSLPFLSFIQSRQSSKMISRIQERRIYQRVSLYDRFVLLTREDQEYWKEIGIYNTEVIHNPRTFDVQVPICLTSKKVLAIGRLDEEKGFDRLIDVWDKLSPLCPDWVLHIYGDGPLKTSLLQQIKTKGLEKSVCFKGVVPDIQRVMPDYSLLMMTSRIEGLPMVLLEAGAMGMPMLSFSFPCGPKDVIRNGIDGFVVPEGDDDSFVECAVQLMTSYELRKEMGLRAFENSSKFKLERIMNQWEDLFNSLYNQK